jgi:hypothetical protein
MATPVMTIDSPRLWRRLTTGRRRLAECREAIGNIVDLDDETLEILALRESEILAEYDWAMRVPYQLAAVLCKVLLRDITRRFLLLEYVI